MEVSSDAPKVGALVAQGLADGRVDADAHRTERDSGQPAGPMTIGAALSRWWSVMDGGDV
jgi:hypothetical protein